MNRKEFYTHYEAYKSIICNNQVQKKICKVLGRRLRILPNAFSFRFINSVEVISEIRMNVNATEKNRIQYERESADDSVDDLLPLYGYVLFTIRRRMVHNAGKLRLRLTSHE